MDNNEQKLKEYIRKNIPDVTMSTHQQQRLQQSMLAQIQYSRKPWWKRFLYTFEEFMETTYEISLTPVIAAVGFMVMVSGTAFYGLASPPDNPQTEDVIIHLRQTTMNPNNNPQMVYAPVKKEQSNHADY